MTKKHLVRITKREQKWLRAWAAVFARGFHERGIEDKYTGRELDILAEEHGVIGEMLLEKVFGIPFRWGRRPGPGDGGNDGTLYNGQTADIKFTPYITGQLATIPTREIEADIVILATATADEEWFNVAGWITRERFYQIATPRCPPKWREGTIAVTQEQLKPIEGLLRPRLL